MVSFYVDSASKYTPVIGSDSINFNQSKYAAVISNEKYSGYVKILYNVDVGSIPEQYRLRPTMLNYAGLGDFGFFKQVGGIKLFYSGSYHEDTPSIFSVKEEYDTVNNTFKMTVSMYYSPYALYATVSGTLISDQIQLYFACGDNVGDAGYYAVPTSIFGINVTGTPISKGRSFGIII